MSPAAVIAHGVDIVEVDRIRRMIDDHGERFTARCFTGAEQAYAESGQKRRAERYAVRFACKEAVLKALGTGWRRGVRWQDVEVVRDALGKPSVVVTGQPAERAGSLGITSWLVSLSHTETVAMASVLACGDANRGGTSGAARG